MAPLFPVLKMQKLQKKSKTKKKTTVPTPNNKNTKTTLRKHENCKIRQESDFVLSHFYNLRETQISPILQCTKKTKKRLGNFSQKHKPQVRIYLGGYLGDSCGKQKKKMRTKKKNTHTHTTPKKTQPPQNRG